MLRFVSRSLVVGMLASLTVVVPVGAPMAGAAPAPEWHPAGAVVPDSSSVVAVGSDFAYAVGSTNPIGSSAWAYRSATGWQSIAPMSVPRLQPIAVVLPDGRLLVVGGSDGFAPGPVSTAEIYDPQTGSWSPTSALNGRHISRGFGAVLPGGGVWVAGPGGGGVTELYDIAANTWIRTADMPSQLDPTTGILLTDGRVFFTSGAGDSGIYDPTTNAWSAAAPRGNNRNLSTPGNTALLPSGRVLVLGTGQFLAPGDIAEIYDPVTDSWIATPTAPATLQVFGSGRLPDGRILVSTGCSTDLGCSANLTSFYDESSNAWTAGQEMGSYNTWWSGGLLANGDLITSGWIYGPRRVTPVPDRAPNSSGWYTSTVGTNWATDDPSATTPPHTQLTTQGGATRLQSAPSCLPDGTCHVGVWETKYDDLPPIVYPPIFRPLDVPGNPFIGVSSVVVGTQVFVRAFAVDDPPNLPPGPETRSGYAGGEWFIGPDPGLGNGTPMPLAMFQLNWYIGGSFNVGPNPGTFTFGARARDRAGNWSGTTTGSVTVTPEPDTDGVSSSTENAAPNGGDGNGDGTRDSQQSNVSSLPGPTGSYLTLAAPSGSTLAQVSVIDPAPLSPPASLTLPAGLASFEVAGVPTGQDVTLTIYTASTANVNGYAKYQNGVWSVLPSERVTIFSDRVEIRLTDGGIGDDDGIANGVVVDPGGIVIQTAPLDTTPPTVSGTAAPAANAADWNNGDVVITWATDDPTATTPAPTTVTSEGAGQAVTSEPSCDNAGNCATGTVTVSLDRTAPVVTLNRAADGAVSCNATDVLSGLAGSCTIGTPQQTAPSTFTVSASAVDLAGNTGTGTLTYTVTPTDLALVQGWLTQLNGLQLTGRNATARNRAVDSLRDAAESENWGANGQVRTDEADDVLEQLADAASEIAKITGTPVPAQINNAIVSMTRRWATDAIATAPSRGVRANRITQAQQSLAQGDQHAAQSRASQAIDAYARAYERVTDD